MSGETNGELVVRGGRAGTWRGGLTVGSGGAAGRGRRAWAGAGKPGAPGGRWPRSIGLQGACVRGAAGSVCCAPEGQGSGCSAGRPGAEAWPAGGRACSRSQSGGPRRARRVPGSREEGGGRRLPRAPARRGGRSPAAPPPRRTSCPCSSGGRGTWSRCRAGWWPRRAAAC